MAVLRVGQHATPEGTRRTVTLRGAGAGGGDLAFSYELLGEFELPEPEILDGFVSAVTFFAMQEGIDLHVEGTLTRDFLRNNFAFQEAWRSLEPDRFRQIRISADRIVEEVPRPVESVIAAFSGGVDAVFSILRHADGELGEASLPIRAGLYIYPINDHASGSPERLLRKIRPLLEARDLPLKLVRCDIQWNMRVKWSYSHAAVIHSCLFNYAHAYSHGLLGSSEPYRALVMPWGSNPATDYLLSSPRLPWFHDGGAYSRTEKVVHLAPRTGMIPHLQVCPERIDENCGHCSKCIRTRLNFMAAGVDEPPYFDGALTLADIRHLELATPIDIGEASTILAYARASGRDAWWIRPLARQIAGFERRYSVVRLRLHVRRRLLTLRRSIFRRLHKRRAHPADLPRSAS